MKALIVTIAALVLSGTPALATDPGDYLVEAFEGRWFSGDDALGRPAETTMLWEYTLDDQFMRLSYRIDMGEAGDFAGVAYYRLSPGEGPDAFWADNYGDSHPIWMEVTDSTMTADWGVEGGKQGRTAYQLLGADEMMVTDWILNDGEWRQFNQNTFRRLTQPGNETAP